jgi:hypothetical protein
VTAADFTIADVLAWARTKPADEQYKYWCSQCAIGQFLVATDRAREPLIGEEWWSEGRSAQQHYIESALNEAASAKPNNFGALVARLEALCPNVPPSEWTRLDAYMADIELASA